MKIKEQTRKLAAGCSKHCFEVADRTDEVSSKHCFVVSRKRRKRILKLAKGYYGAKHILFRTAKEQVMNSYYYAYRDRRQKKRDFRKLWITRINAAARMNGLSYSQLMHGLKLAEIEVNRKMLADLAVNDAAAFTALADAAKAKLGK